MESDATKSGRKITGGCNCGAVRYHIDGAPLRVSHCHCEICRRASGGIAATLAAFPAEQVHWQGVEPQTYRSSDFGFRRFCGTCGSQLEFGFDSRPELRIIAVGSMDDPSMAPAMRHNFISEKVAWVHLDEHLPAKARWWNPPPGHE